MTQLSDEVVERVALGLYAIEDSWNDIDWEYLPASTQKLFRKQARAAIAAYEASRETILNQIEQEFPADMGIGPGK